MVSILFETRRVSFENFQSKFINSIYKNSAIIKFEIIDKPYDDQNSSIC